MSIRTRHQIIGVGMIVLALTFFFITPETANAARVFPDIVPNCDQTLTGENVVASQDRCDFTDFIQLFINLFDWGLAILSILSVTFFIIGGATLLFSAGNSDRVRVGTSILKNTLFGVLIALASWLIINSVIGILVGSGTFSNVQVFGETWWGVPSCSDEYSQECGRFSLKEGCGDISTNHVSEIQRLIREAPGCPQITADGCFGPQTTSAVLSFNEANDLDVVGEVSRRTWELLQQGVGCTNSSAEVEEIVAGTGCCVASCGIGIDNTDETSCQTIYSGALWYNGSCSVQSKNTTPGCCVRIVNTEQTPCAQEVNQDWCVNYGSLATNGVFYENATCSEETHGCTSIQNSCN